MFLSFDYNFFRNSIEFIKFHYEYQLFSAFSDAKLKVEDFQPNILSWALDPSQY